MPTESAAPSAFRLHVPPPRLMTSAEELALARVAVDRAPAHPGLRHRLGALLVQADAFEEAIAVLEGEHAPTSRTHELTAHAHLSLETAEHDHLAEDHLRQAVALAGTPIERTAGLALLAKALIRQGRTAEARVALDESLLLSPHDKNAYKRAFALELHGEAPERAAALAARAMEDGVLHSRVLASQTLALARMGMVEAARRAQGLARFHAAFEPTPPPGWPALADFTAELAAELATHPDQRFGRYGTASSQTWRIDQPGLRRSRVLPALQALVVREVAAYVEALATQSEPHPFLDARPTEARLRNWCVLVEGDGHETWHVHQNGWLSGVFYVQVPEHIAHGTGPEGTIAFGLPPEEVGEENAAAFGELRVRPRAGLMMLFPSHTFHRTYPHAGTGRRICYAFDVVPAAGDGVS